MQDKTAAGSGTGGFQVDEQQATDVRHDHRHAAGLEHREPSPCAIDERGESDRHQNHTNHRGERVSGIDHSENGRAGVSEVDLEDCSNRARAHYVLLCASVA